MNTNNFSLRHIGNHDETITEMLSVIGKNSIEELIEATLPNTIRLGKTLDLPDALSEFEATNHLAELAAQNTKVKNYLGYGYYGTILPAPIQRNVLENPGWYTAYTPYQAEIAQGRLEALLNFQTVISDLTGLPIANASLLDEGTACGEAMHMLLESRSREQKKNNVLKFFVADNLFPQSIAVLQTKAHGLGIELVVGNYETIELDDTFFGAIVQYIGKGGQINQYQTFVEKAKATAVKVAVATDLLALTLLTPPGEWGAEIAVGTSQRFGIPMGYGGPHAAFLACTEEYKRVIPGRIIGVSQDRLGNYALRMALQTREQHIKREKATSNICTAQVLLAVMASFYAVYHGKEGLTFIANQIHTKAGILQAALQHLGYETTNTHFFDTVQIKTDNTQDLVAKFRENDININGFEEGKVSITIDEMTSEEDVFEIISIFASLKNTEDGFEFEVEDSYLPEDLLRTSDFLTHDNFKLYHTETELMRYIKRLERKDLALNQSMIALGSCTMKLNAATELLHLSWERMGNIHPFAPKDQVQGYQTLIKNLEKYLAEITGFDATSLQPNSGAQGEYAGLMVIRSYFESKGEGHRNVALIPQSAHGTNPASAAMAGMQVVVVKNLETGETDLEDLKEKCEKYKDNLAALMITYPSTYGAFDSNIEAVTEMIHAYGGQVYMDGANMNAQVGLTSPGNIGADVCHLNLHKTFAIPHGGGGPGVGPICVKAHLAPFLGSSPLIETGGKEANNTFAAAPYGSAFILPISYTYILMLGAEGLLKATQGAIINANYMKARLEKYYDILYTNANKVVAHEFILDCRPFKKIGIEVTDIAKRLIDYGFHAPTVSFPVAGTLMVEPTESENKAELDRFCEAMIAIRAEIDEIANGEYPADNNVLHNAPHPQHLLTADEWDYPYTRAKAAYPLEWVRERKFFSSVSRIDDAYGDRNLVCTCAPIEAYMD
ncbi:aminomethyl-transferring glycine dehydrogenase [Weeksella virosa]|uniref:glycine dehydrogenase (aminomethyl-transferring) n=1 Tax=Weeksella virosa (strain ATCC 43766 / DSM 16922 / JCM 21250 / CCUG 30538 / CDC 9751 / IAM 14551 / NBRC 16016 / NCTC 11634 / CL345/78) TaxID=865938 RepID=F0NZH8_WEEVC|nr:aminomethyl-transferring glycine dehydrogenase [Weeksella virosa]ADX68325.1 glycine dehydrogenase [Weeksella virosa DSM 16922]VEH64034.1 Glycine dehydrogenase [decarboxylating] [Weeksella virosa]